MPKIVAMSPIPQRIKEQIYTWCEWLPNQYHTIQNLQQALENTHPEPKWLINIYEGDIEVRMEFDDPHDLTMFILRHA